MRSSNIGPLDSLEDMQYHIVERAKSEGNFSPLVAAISLFKERQFQTSNYKYLNYSKNSVLMEHALTFTIVLFFCLN